MFIRALTFQSVVLYLKEYLDHYIGARYRNVPTTMSSVGKIESFDPTQETLPHYVKRIKNFFSTNEVADAKQKYVFLN